MTRKTTLAGAAMALVLVSSPCFAQGAGSDINPEQRARIKAYITQERIAPVTMGERVTVGARLPAEVELRPVPSDWGPSVTRYRYIYSGNQVYFVEPSTREVVQVID